MLLYCKVESRCFVNDGCKLLLKIGNCKLYKDNGYFIFGFMYKGNGYFIFGFMFKILNE